MTYQNKNDGEKDEVGRVQIPPGPPETSAGIGEIRGHLPNNFHRLQMAPFTPLCHELFSLRPRCLSNR